MNRSESADQIPKGQERRNNRDRLESPSVSGRANLIQGMSGRVRHQGALVGADSTGASSKKLLDGIMGMITMNGRCGSGSESLLGRVNSNSPMVGGGATGGPADGPWDEDARALLGTVPVIKSALPR